MHILHIISSRRCGGAEKYVAILAKQQRAAGHSVYFYRNSFPCFDTLLEGLAEEDVTTHIWNSISPIHLFRLYAFIRSRKIDIIHTHLSKASILGGVIGKLARIPVVATVHGMNSFHDYRFCSHLIAVSHAVRDHLIASGAMEKNITVVHNGVEPPADTRSSHPYEGTHFVFVGRLEEEKGLAVFLKTLARFTKEKWHFTIVGTGSQEHVLRSVVAECAIDARVTFVGYSTTPGEWFSRADIVVMPSLKEGFGIAAIEAFSYGIPVLASNAGGLPEIVTDGSNGYVFIANDPQSLYQTLAKVFLSDLRPLGDVALASFTQKFTSSVLTIRIMEEYERLIASSHNNT